MTVLDDALATWAEIEGLPSALAGARDGVDALLRDRGLRRTTPADTAEALVRGAVASARLDGSTSSLDDLRSDRGDTIAVDAARLNAQLLTLVPVIGRSPLQAFARLHAVAAPHEPSAGRPGGGPTAALDLQALGAAIVGAPQTPGVVLAAIAHAEMMRIRPFDTANGLLARAVERLLLVSRGVDPACVLVPEAGHLAAGVASYEGALEAYANGTRSGTAQWLHHAATAIGVAVAASPLAERARLQHPKGTLDR